MQRTFTARQMGLAGLQFLLLLSASTAFAQSPSIVSISPATGPEGTRVEITGTGFVGVTAVLFGDSPAAFRVNSPTGLTALVPHKTLSSAITAVTVHGRATSPQPFVTVNDPRVPEEVSYKAGYVNPAPVPADFGSAMLWGIAIADTRVPGHEKAQVEIAWMQLACSIDGKAVILNDDSGAIRGGLYRRHPWFGTDKHAPMTLGHNGKEHAAVMAVGQHPDVVWHFWSASPRVALPHGKLEGCIVKVRAKVSPGALLQVGMDYWRDATITYGPGGNNHEAGASSWYFPSDQWQEATFTDIGGPKF